MAMETIEEVGIGRPFTNEWVTNFCGAFSVLATGLEFRPFENTGLIYITASELIAGNYERPTAADVSEAVSELTAASELGPMAVNECGTILTGPVKVRRISAEGKCMLKIRFQDWPDDGEYPEGAMLLGEENAMRREWEMGQNPGKDNGNLLKHALHIGEVIGPEASITKKLLFGLTDMISRRVSMSPISTVRSPIFVEKDLNPHTTHTATIR